MYYAIASALGHDEKTEYGEDAEELQQIETAHGVEIIALPEEKTREASKLLQKRRMNLAKMLKGMLSGEEEAPLKEDDGPKWSPGEILTSIFPVVHWLPGLTPSKVKADLIAGLTVGVMAIPQGMSYANIAGLPYIYGMYSACVPTLIYAFFGESRQLAVGPVAMVSLLVEAGLRSSQEACLADGHSEEHCTDEYVKLAILTSLCVGAMQLAAAVLRLGFLVSFLGHPVTSGFTSAAAIIIGLSQVKYIVGYDVPKSQYVYETVGNLFSKISHIEPAPLILGILSIAFLMTTRKISQRYKKRLSLLGPLGPLILCVMGIVACALIDPLQEDLHVKTIGEIPSGLIPLSVGWPLGDVGLVLPTAMSACLIGYMESIAIGKNLAAKNGYTIEAGQELLALGMANLVGACFSCYPVTGSFSRSAVNQMTGAQTQLSGVITSLLMLLTLLFLTPLFTNLPKFVLAAIVINSVIPLVAYQEARKLYSIKRQDFVLWVVAFIGTLFLGVLMGIALAVLLSLGMVVHESVRPQITILWRIPGTTIYRNVKQETRGAFIPNMFIARIGSSMYFANAAYIKDILVSYIQDLDEVNKTEYLVMEMTSVVSIDTTAVHILHDIVSEFRVKGINLAFAMVGNRVNKTMQKAKLKEFIGEQWFFPTVEAAVIYCRRHQHAMRKRAERGECRAAVTDECHEAHCRQPDFEQFGDGTMEIDSIPSMGMRNDGVAFSNEIHASCTTVIVYLYQDATDLMTDVLATFRSRNVTVIRAQVEPTFRDTMAKHMYFVKTQDRASKLSDEEIDDMREVLNELLKKRKAFDRATSAESEDPESKEMPVTPASAAAKAAMTRLAELEDMMKSEQEKRQQAQDALTAQQHWLHELLAKRSAEGPTNR